MRVSIFLIMLLFLAAVSLAQAKQNCAPMGEQKVKVEAWLSKKYEPDLKDIAEEFVERDDLASALLGKLFHENAIRAFAVEPPAEHVPASENAAAHAG